MARQLGNPFHLFQVSRGSQATYVHHKRHRRVQPAATQGHQIKDYIPHRRQPAKNAVSSNDGHHEEMDRAQAGLWADPFPVRDLF